MTISTTDLGLPVGEDLDRVVEEQLRDVQVAGATYRFRPETHCKVCRNEALRSRVEDLLAAGTTYREILAIIAVQNVRRARRDQITYHSIRKHASECFELTRAAQIVFRKIMERRAKEQNLNFVKGVGHIVTIQAVLEVVMVKGFAAITDDRMPITPELAISAGLKLHELESHDAGASRAAEMIAQVQRIKEAVYSVCSEDQIRAIDAYLDPGDGDDSTLDAEWTEEDDEDDDDDNEFDPSTDMDEAFNDTPEDF